jgi:hypothetical protein
MSEEQSTVEYRPVIGFPNHRVGSDGSVWSNVSGQWRKRVLYRAKDGYLRVSLRHRNPAYVHSLICEAFHGPRPAGMQVRHFPDRNRSNNAADNLRWGTCKQNCEDREAHGMTRRGQGLKAKLTAEAVVEIIAAYKSGQVTQGALARMYGVSQSVISRILSGKKWAHVSLSKAPA